MKEALMRGANVQMRSGGTSLQPLVYAGDTCFFDPIRPGVNSNIRAGDIVFCHVLPTWHYYVHLVWTVERMDVNAVMKDTYQIGNNKKGEARVHNGHTHREYIYGIFVKRFSNFCGGPKSS